MAVLYYTRFQSVALKNYVVELWSDATGTSPLQAFNAYKARVIADGGYIEDEQALLDSLNALSGTEELTAQGEGVQIERQGESDTFFDNPIRASRANAYFIVSTDAQLAAFQSIATDPEGTYALKVYRDNALLFVGRVLADQMRFERADPDGKITIQVAAVDALNLIDGFFVEDSWFTDDHAGGIYLLRKCLELSGLDDFWLTGQDYIFDGLEQYESATQSVSDQKLNTFWFNRLAFVDNLNVFGGIELSYVNAKQAIEIILNGFGARIHHDNGAYFITQTPTYLSSTLTFHKYDKAGTYNGTNTLAHAVSLGTLPARPQWEAKPQLYYQPPIRVAENNFIKANGAYIKRSTASASQLELYFDRPPQSHNFRVQINLESELPPARSYHQVRYRVYGVDGSPTSFYYYYSGLTWNSQAGIPSYQVVAYKDQLQPSSSLPISLSLDFVGPIGSGPAANITQFVVDVRVDAITPVWVRDPISGGWWQTYQLNNLSFTGAIASAYAYNSYTPGTTDDFTQDVTLKATNSIGANSKLVEVNEVFYDGLTKYEGGTILVGSSYASAVIPTSWGNGWQAGYFESFQQSKADQVVALYNKFKDVVRGTWHDNGTLTAVKSLYFDGGAWLLNGCTFSANSERWEGEWLKIDADYTDVVQTGEEDNRKPSERVYFQTQIDELKARLGTVEQITGSLPDQLSEDFIEVSDGAPTSDPGVDGTYTVALKYDASSADFSWQMRRLGASLNVTSDITTFPTEYEIFICDTSGGSITIDLPAPPSVTPGLRFGFIKTASANSLTLDAGAGYQINDAQLKSWNARFETYWVQSDGTQWYIVASDK